MENEEVGVRLGGRNINNLRYADDTTLIVSCENDLKHIIEVVQAASEKAGILFNVKKTKVMSTANLQRFEVIGLDIEVISKFNFLGSVITREGDCGEEVKRRIVLGKTAMGGLNKIWKDKNISQVTKVRLVRAIVFPIATYACETWTMRKSEI